MKKSMSLGRGLSALLNDNVHSISSNDSMQLLNVNMIEVCELQPRKTFDYDAIRELANSILSNGLLQPIIVTRKNDEKYQIVAGERRWRASIMAGLASIPVIIQNLSAQEILEIALVENIQREDLTAIEEAEAFEKLIQDFEYTQEKLAEMLGKSRSHVSNLLRLNSLPIEIKEKVNQKLLSMGHARCLVGHQYAQEIAQYVIENDLNVRQTEELVKNWSKKEFIANAKNNLNLSKKITNNNPDNDLQILAKTLSEKFNIKVSIEQYNHGGKLIFHYENLEQLDSILDRL